jgi:hypothetical protein
VEAEPEGEPLGEGEGVPVGDTPALALRRGEAVPVGVLHIEAEARGEVVLVGDAPSLGERRGDAEALGVAEGDAAAPEGVALPPRPPPPALPLAPRLPLASAEAELLADTAPPLAVGAAEPRAERERVTVGGTLPLASSAVGVGTPEAGAEALPAAADGDGCAEASPVGEDGSEGEGSGVGVSSRGPLGAALPLGGALAGGEGVAALLSDASLLTLPPRKSAETLTEGDVPGERDAEGEGAPLREGGGEALAPRGVGEPLPLRAPTVGEPLPLFVAPAPGGGEGLPVTVPGAGEGEGGRETLSRPLPLGAPEGEPAPGEAEQLRVPTLALLLGEPPGREAEAAGVVVPPAGVPVPRSPSRFDGDGEAEALPPPRGRAVSLTGAGAVAEA